MPKLLDRTSWSRFEPPTPSLMCVSLQWLCYFVYLSKKKTLKEKVSLFLVILFFLLKRKYHKKKKREESITSRGRGVVLRLKVI